MKFKNCSICGIELKGKGNQGKSQHLRHHLDKIHNISMQRYYDMHFRDKYEGYCWCCKKETIFSCFNVGYSNICSDEECKKWAKSHKPKQNSKKWYILRYGEIEGKEKFEERNKRNSFNQTLEGLIQKYGEIEGQRIFEERQKTSSLSNSLNGYIKKYGEIEGQRIFEERQKKIIKSKSLDSFKERYGEIEGKEKWDKWKYDTKTAATLEGYIRHYGEIEGKEKWEQRLKLSSFNSSLSGYLIRYGEIEGKEKFEKARFKNTLNAYIEKYGEFVGGEKYLNRLKKIIEKRKFYFSKVSQELFEELNKTIKNSLYGKSEYYIKSKGSSFYSYDFTVIEKKKIIEFNGDYWHANPLIYEADDLMNYPGRKTLAKDIWAKDLEKNNFAKLNGFDVLVIWEQEFVQNKEATIQKCLDFLK